MKKREREEEEGVWAAPRLQRRRDVYSAAEWRRAWTHTEEPLGESMNGTRPGLILLHGTGEQAQTPSQKTAAHVSLFMLLNEYWPQLMVCGCVNKEEERNVRGSRRSEGSAALRCACGAAERRALPGPRKRLQLSAKPVRVVFCFLFSCVRRFSLWSRTARVNEDRAFHGGMTGVRSGQRTEEEPWVQAA